MHFPTDISVLNLKRCCQLHHFLGGGGGENYYIWIWKKNPLEGEIIPLTEPSLPPNWRDILSFHFNLSLCLTCFWLSRLMFSGWVKKHWPVPSPRPMNSVSKTGGGLELWRGKHSFAKGRLVKSPWKKDWHPIWAPTKILWYNWVWQICHVIESLCKWQLVGSNHDSISILANKTREKWRFSGRCHMSKGVWFSHRFEHQRVKPRLAGYSNFWNLLSGR